MPPKKGKGKGDKKKKDDSPKEEGVGGPAVVAGPLTSGKTVDELWDECAGLLEEVDSESKPRKHFNIERDMAKSSWENSNRRLKEATGRMREKLRLKEETEKECRTVVEEHKRKLKQLETAHHDEIFEQKVAAVTSTSNTDKEHVKSEVDLRKTMHSLHADMAEKDSHNKIYITRHKQKQWEDLQQLNKFYETKAREVEGRYKKKMEIKFEKNNTMSENELKEVDDTMKEHSENAVAEHETVWSDLNKSLRDKLDVGLENETLRLEFDALTKKDQVLDRKNAAGDREGINLTTCLQDIQPHLCDGRAQLRVQRTDMAKSLKREKKATELILVERREVILKHQQLELQHEQAQRECDELQKRQTLAILDVQKKSDLKALVLQKKIKAVMDIQEREHLQLRVALTFGQGEPTAAKILEEQFRSKDAIIKALKDDVSQEIKKNDDLVERSALDFSMNTWLPSVRMASEDNIPQTRKNFDDLMQELTALRISEDKSCPKDESRQ